MLQLCYVTFNETDNCVIHEFPKHLHFDQIEIS